MGIIVFIFNSIKLKHNLSLLFMQISSLETAQDCSNAFFDNKNVLILKFTHLVFGLLVIMFFLRWIVVTYGLVLDYAALIFWSL